MTKKVEPPPIDLQTEAGQLAVTKTFGRKHTPSELIFPDQQIPLRFSHAKHVELVACTDCHATVNQSLRAKDRNLPKEAVCLDCHDHAAAARGEPTDPPASCDTCHPGFEPKWLPGADFTDTSKVEDRVTARVAANVNVGGETVIPEGSRVTGVVTYATPSAKVKGRAAVTVRFRTLTIGSQSYDITAEPLRREAAGTKAKDARDIGIGAGAGAIVGGIIGGRKGAGIGAAVGGAGGTGVVLATRGDEVRLPSGTSITTRLEAPVTVEVMRH